MSVDYEAKMIYGARYIDIVGALSQEEIDELNKNWPVKVYSEAM